MAHGLLCLLLCLAHPEAPLCGWQPPGGTIVDPCPTFAWHTEGQLAWRLTVATDPGRLDHPDLWDSGWVDGPLGLAEYAGRPLPVGVPFAWQVHTRDGQGTEATPPGTTTLRPRPLPRKQPTVRSFLNFGAPMPALAEYDVTFERAAREARPDALRFNYSLLATMVVPSAKHDQLLRFADVAHLGPAQVEAMFLHFGEDTPVKLHVGREAVDHPVETRTIRGWDPRNDRDGDGTVSEAEAARPANPKATARTPRQARVPIYYFGPPADDFVMYPGNPEFRRFLAEVYAPAQLQGYEGLYIDTLTSSPPGPAQNGLLAECRAAGPDGWRRDMLNLLAAVKTALPETPIVGNGWLSDPFVIDGTQWENWLDLRANATQVRAAVEAVRALDRRGRIQWVQYNPIAPDDRPSFAARLPVTLARDQLYGVAAYLLALGDRTCFGYGQHPYGDAWKLWPGCVNVDLGAPVGEPTAEPLAAADAGGPNLLRNGDFEADLTGWEPAPPYDLAPEGRAGSHALRLHRDGDSNDITKQWLDLKPHTTYTLSAWIRTEGVDGGGAQVYPWEFGQVQPVGGQGFLSVTGTTDWHPYELVFRTGDSGHGRINVRLFHARGTAWFDDLKLVEGGHATAWLLRREFAKGLVLVRPNALGLYDDTTAREVELPKPYRPVDAAGKVGEPVSRVRLREGEAAVLRAE